MFNVCNDGILCFVLGTVTSSPRKIQRECLILYRAPNECLSLCVCVSVWCLVDRRLERCRHNRASSPCVGNIGVVHIAFMSVKMFALTNDIYIWIFCALHTVFRWFLGSFDTADDGRTTFSNTIRLFDLIFAYISQAGLFFVCLYVWVLLPMAFGWCVFQRVYTVLCRTFKPKLHLICQKMYYKPQKKTSRSSQAKGIGTI